MDDPVDACQELGEVVLEEVLVRAGIDQAHSAPADELRLALEFVVGVDAERDQLVIRGTRLGQSPFELRLDLREVPAEWRAPRERPASSRAGGSGTRKRAPRQGP